MIAGDWEKSDIGLRGQGKKVGGVSCYDAEGCWRDRRWGGGGGGVALWETMTSSLSVCEPSPVNSSLAGAPGAEALLYSSAAAATLKLGTSSVLSRGRSPSTATLFLLGQKQSRRVGGSEGGMRGWGTQEEGCRCTPYPPCKTHPQSTPLLTTTATTTHPAQPPLSSTTAWGLQVRMWVNIYWLCVCACVMKGGGMSGCICPCV